MRTILQFLAGFFGPWNDGTLLNTLASLLKDTSIGRISFGIIHAVSTTSDKLPLDFCSGGATILQHLVTVGTMHTMTQSRYVKHWVTMEQSLQHRRPLGPIAVLKPLVPSHYPHSCVRLYLWLRIGDVCSWMQGRTGRQHAEAADAQLQACLSQ